VAVSVLAAASVAPRGACHRFARRAVRLPLHRAARQRTATALALAAAIDLLAGEPPNRLHPVAWIGTLIERLVTRAPSSEQAAFAYGVALAAGVPCLTAAAALVVECAAGCVPAPLDAVALALALKPSFALRALLGAGSSVEARLAAGDVEGARGALSALVSRETATLDAGLVVAAAIESLAENLGDGLAGPLLAYAVAGLPGAWAYRALNTLDSMVGYHGRFEWLGKASARLDDLANLLPARVAALALVVAAPLAGGSARDALRAAVRDHALTASPNAGWPMSAAAGAIGVRLEKLEHYALNPDGRAPTTDDLRRARTLTAAAGALLIAAGLAGSLARDRRSARNRRVRAEEI
jgi:adenosylcobinamide-phosphate synthase